MELTHVLRTIRKWWWLILLSAAAAAVSSYLVVREQPPVYRTKASLMVGRALENPNPSGYDFSLGQQLAQTYAEIARRSPIREATMTALGLDWLPEYNVTQVPNTQLLEISVTDTYPRRAQAVANELAHQLLQQSPDAGGPENQQRREFVARQIPELEIAIEDTKARIVEQEEALAGLYSARQIADTQEQIAALERKLGGFLDRYIGLLGFMEGGVNTLQIVEPASVPTRPISDSGARTIAAAMAIGIVLALGVAFLLDYLDDSLVDPEEVEHFLHLPVLGTIGRAKLRDPADQLMAASHPHSVNTEAFRILLTNLQLLDEQHPAHIQLVTSSEPADGKTTTVANLGIVMAQQGQRVVLIDCDLRHPSLHELFSLPNDTGLTDAVHQGLPASNGLLRETFQENLRVIPSGSATADPVKLLNSEGFAALLDQVKGDADAVLLDSPPILAVADAIVLARLSDQVLLVVNAGKTRRKRAVRSRGALDRVGARIVGVCMNRLKPSQLGYYYDYQCYYGGRDRSTPGE